MADITMCKGKHCPLKDSCHRYTANRSTRQSYFLDVPYNTITKSCDHFWNNDEKRTRRTTEEIKGQKIQRGDTEEGD